MSISRGDSEIPAAAGSLSTRETRLSNPDQRGRNGWLKRRAMNWHQSARQDHELRSAPIALISMRELPN